MYNKMYIELTANQYHSVNHESKTISNNKAVAFHFLTINEGEGALI